MPTLIGRLKHLAFGDRALRRNPLFYRPALELLRDFDSRSPDAQREWRTARLRQVLARAGTTGYGRRVHAPRALSDWPVLEKDAVRRAPRDFEALPRWLSIAASTSGTSGTPLALRRSWDCIAFEQAVLDRMLERVGVATRNYRSAVLRGDDIKSPADRDPPYWRRAAGGRRLVFSSNHLDAATVDHFVAALRAHQPEVIFAYPTVLDSLCALMLQRGERLEVPLVVCGSEVLSSATCELAGQVLGARVLDYYGQAERVAFASGDPVNGYRFLAPYSINELRFLETTAEGDVYGVLGTALWNRAMPLIRYDTGDRILVPRERHITAVADGRECFTMIAGRSGDYILSPTGARLLGIDHIPRNVPHIVRTQFIQESATRVRLLVVPAPGFGDDSRRLLEQHASLKLPPSMSLHIETTTDLVRTASGKAPLVLRPFQGA